MEFIKRKDESEENKKKLNEKKTILEEKSKQAKLQKYNTFVRSFAQANKKNQIFDEVSKIQNNKCSIYVFIKINEVKFNIKKMFYDITKPIENLTYKDLQPEDYLVLFINVFTFDFSITEKEDMLVNLKINDIGLSDLDIDLKKNKILHNRFTCLIRSLNNEQNKRPFFRKLKEGFIDIQYLYKKEAEEMDTFVNLYNLNIIISFDSLLRMYQFSMYYLDKYTSMVEETNSNNPSNEAIKPVDSLVYLNEVKKRKENKRSHKKEVLFNDDWMKNVKSVFDNNKNEVNKNKKLYKKFIKKVTEIYDIQKKIDIGEVIEEHKKDLMKVFCNMENTCFRLPLDATKRETEVFIFDFNLKYYQEWKNIYTNYITTKNGKIYKTIYDVQDSKMNLFLSKLNIDMRYYNQILKRFVTSLSTERLLNNFRLCIDLSMYILPKEENSVIETDIVIEPMQSNVGIRQLRKLLILYNVGMKFINLDMQEKYIPLLKPNYIENGKIIIPVRKKMKLKECIKRILIIYRFQKLLKTQLKTLIEKKSENITIVNTSKFNNYIKCTVKIERISMSLMDNTGEDNILLFNIEMSKFNVLFISNSAPNDKKNMGNAILEMFTGIETPLEEYNFENMSTYLNMYMTFEANYYNINLCEWEPFIESFKMSYIMYQVSTFMRNKNILNIPDMINCNISSNAIKALNIFLLKYLVDESYFNNKNDTKTSEENKEKEKHRRSFKKKKSEKEIQERRERIRKRIEEFEKIKKEEIILEIINETGLDLKYCFDSNPNNIRDLDAENKHRFNK